MTGIPRSEGRTKYFSGVGFLELMVEDSKSESASNIIQVTALLETIIPRVKKESAVNTFLRCGMCVPHVMTPSITTGIVNTNGALLLKPSVAR